MDFIGLIGRERHQAVQATNIRDARCLADELILEILARLPLKSIARFSSVSKGWHAMITSDDGYHRRKLPRAMSGIFYSGIEGDHSEHVSTSRPEEGSKDLLSFLPPHQMTMVLCSCNGMILARCLGTDPDADDGLFVCNPATKRWTKIPKPADKYRVLALAFDPRLSPHYRAVTISAWNGGDDGQMDIWSSETGQWEGSRCFKWAVDISSGFFDDYTTVFLLGNIHLVHSLELAVVAFDPDRKACRTMRLPAPVEYCVEYCGREQSLVEFGGSLRCAVQADYNMLVWDLEDYHQNRWILKYRISLREILEKSLVKQLLRTHVAPLWNAHMVALHPDMDAVFLVVDGTLVSCRLHGSNDVTIISVLKGTYWYGFCTHSPYDFD